MKHALLVLDDWLFLPIAYLSIHDDPGVCKQLILSFIGKFFSSTAPSQLNWAETETLRFARRLLRPFTALELSIHLRISKQYARKLLLELVNQQKLIVASGNMRYRTFRLPNTDN